MKSLVRSLGLGAVCALACAGAASAQEMSPDAVFSFVDSDGDGAVSFEEINSANANVTEEVFAEYDDNGDGALSLAEFTDLFENGPPPPGV